MQCDLLSCQNAGWQGVTLNTTRGHFYRAALEGLTAQLQRNLQMLEKIGHFKASELLLVGGGSRNTLWNQIKANMLDIPVKVLDDAETTVAALLLAYFTIVVSGVDLMTGRHDRLGGAPGLGAAFGALSTLRIYVF